MNDGGDADDFDWMREPLPERPGLRTLKYWVSEHPVAALMPLVAALVMFAAVAFGRPTWSQWALAPLLVAYILLLGFGPGGLADRIVKRKLRSARRRHPVEPWRYDRDWNERGETRSSLTRIAAALQAQMQRRAYVVAFVWIGVWAAVFVGKLWWAPVLVAGAAVTWGACAAWRLHGAGDMHVSFTKFPFHPGEAVTLHVGMSEGGALFRRAEFRLFHVREFAGGCLNMQRGTGVGVHLFEHRPPGPLPGPDFDVEVSFDLPTSAPGTRLADDLPSYWVLEVCGVTSAGPYVERFLVPIYDRPAAAEPAA